MSEDDKMVSYMEVMSSDSKSPRAWKRVEFRDGMAVVYDENGEPMAFMREDQYRALAEDLDE